MRETARKANEEGEKGKERKREEGPREREQIRPGFSHLAALPSSRRGEARRARRSTRGYCLSARSYENYVLRCSPRRCSRCAQRPERFPRDTSIPRMNSRLKSTISPCSARRRFALPPRSLIARAGRLAINRWELVPCPVLGIILLAHARAPAIIHITQSAAPTFTTNPRVRNENCDTKTTRSRSRVSRPDTFSPLARVICRLGETPAVSGGVRCERATDHRSIATRISLLLRFSFWRRR